jgi:uncharacterized protein YecA (UPF0149 family)
MDYYSGERPRKREKGGRSIEDIKLQKEREMRERKEREEAFELRPKVGRNAKCPCGSDKKFKFCCWNKYK